ncbi:MAG: flagellar export chaperone FlgN, partial [Methyloprofundus sp.]|nr:flagellar export chaperone FlgN [Methyloprofundus sp.]
MIDKTHAITLQLVETALENTKLLFQILTKEAALLKTKTQAHKLEVLTKQKNEVIALLTTFSKQVEQILASEKLSNEQGMDAYFDIAKKAGMDTSISYKNWLELIEVSKKCRATNEQNGACLHILNKHSLRVLDVLKGKDPTVTTYSKSGHARGS